MVFCDWLLSLSIMFSRVIHVVSRINTSFRHQEHCIDTVHFGTPRVVVAVKNLPANSGDVSLTPGSGRSPGGGHGNLLQYSCLENPLGQSSLTGYSPWAHKESDSAEVAAHVLAGLVCFIYPVISWWTCE